MTGDMERLRELAQGGRADVIRSYGSGEPGAAGAYLVPEELVRALAANVQQLGRIVAAQQKRLDDMEREAARRVTVSHAQALALGRQIAARATKICQDYALPDPSDAAAVRRAIKKDVLTRYGIRDIHDLPLSCLDAAADRIARYMSIGLVKERRMRDS